MNRRQLLFAALNAAGATVAARAAPVARASHNPRVDLRPDPIDPELIRKLAAAMSRRTGAPDRYDAEVWLHWVTPKIARYMHDTGERTRLVGAVRREAAQHEIDPDLVLAVIDVESRFDRYAVSRAGAQGVMQIMPFWKKLIGRDQDNLIHIDTNIRYGTTILAHYIQRSDSDVVSALARYNGSHGLLNYPERVMYSWRHRWQSRLSSEIPEMVAGCTRYQLDACAR